ncbi:MAG: hypothetical protein IJ640_07910 [Prevotella sp.]|nr:hypothetical protein [Prevotella sp.]
MKKSIERAVEVLNTIKAEVNKDAIKGHHIPTLCDLDTGDDIGFSVVLQLSTKYDYPSTLLDSWRERFGADDFLVSVMRNQLHVRFNVHYQLLRAQAQEFASAALS